MTFALGMVPQTPLGVELQSSGLTKEGQIRVCKLVDKLFELSDSGNIWLAVEFFMKSLWRGESSRFGESHLWIHIYINLNK